MVRSDIVVTPLAHPTGNILMTVDKGNQWSHLSNILCSCSSTVASSIGALTQLSTCTVKGAFTDLNPLGRLKIGGVCTRQLMDEEYHTLAGVRKTAPSRLLGP